jgi:hypothetical protein
MPLPAFARFTLTAFAFVAAIALQPSARAGEAAAGETVLTVATDRGTAVFDLAKLQTLGTVIIETSTPWTEGVQRFEGVPVRKVLEAVGATGETVMARGLDRYVAVIPVEDLHRYEVILAFRQNGELLSPSDDGPLFLMYPYDRDAGLRHQQTYSRSVWQLTELQIL